jgi:hypothetical protein
MGRSDVMNNRKEKTLYLYDPRTNILSHTTYSDLEELTGMTKPALTTQKSRGQRIGRIGCYLTDDGVTVQQRKAWYEKQKYENETWKVIDGSDDKFLISNYGRFKRVYKNHIGFLLPYFHPKSGRLAIKVMFQNKYTQYRIADLVAHHYIGKKEPGKGVYHKNGIKTDDYHGNLEYLSKSELGKKTGHKSRAREVVQLDKETGEVLGEFTSAREAGRKCFVSYQSVTDCCNGKYKSSGGVYLFKWADEYEYAYELDGDQIEQI